MRNRQASSASGAEREQARHRAGRHVRVLRPRPVGVARPLSFECGRDPERHVGRALAPDVGRFRRVDAHPQVEAVEQRRAQPSPVPLALRVAAAAALRARAARTRVRARDELERGGEGERHRLARDAYRPLLERLPQRVERAGRELPELVEEQHAPVRECDLARAGAAAPAADERGGRRGVVGGAERPAADEAAGDRFAGGGVDAGDLERLGGGQGREDGAQSPGEHRLAGAGRAAEQQVVAAGGRDLERLAGERQPPHVGEVDQLVVAECRFEVRSGSAAGGSQSGQGSSPFRHARSSPRVRAARTRTPPTSSASEALATGTTTAPTPARASASTSARVPGTGRTEPSRPSSPSTATPSSTPAGSASLAPSRPSATASSSPEPDLRTPPGARLTVMRRWGHSRPDDNTAARTCSRDSRTAASGSPTTWYAGRPDETWTSTVTG